MAEPSGNGSWWRCTRCDELTDDCLKHNLAVHSTAIVAYSDFALRRGSLHDPTGPRSRVEPLDGQLTMGATS